MAALALAGCATAPATSTLTGAQVPAVAPVLATPDAFDSHSYARPLEARVTHVALELAADFASRTMSGTATLDVRSAPTARELVLDTRDLTIRSVTNGGGAPLPFTLGAIDPVHGAPLTIQHGGAERVRISYATAPGAPALQWLTPDQTAGKAQPFLFSQGQAILNRSWIPTQDSPGIRQTWEAAVTVPAPLTAVMSAEMLTPRGEPAGPGRTRYRFRMDKPVAPYLIALAVGDLAFRATGPRTGVWAEPVTLPKAADEFADLEKMVTAAEGLYGPYRWGRYDLLVLPPAFPFGGMENPRLTFVTPTVLAGDRSLTSLVAHELAHSWSGNLVTNATWDDFWLNEGFTVYFENRIMEALYGRERAAMLADLGWSDLQSALTDNAGPDTALHLDLAGRDPDEGLTDIAYEKGATFLRTLEAAVGRERWDAYLTGYFDRYAFQPQTTARFRADLLANQFGGDEAAMARVGVDQWLYQPGLPANAVHITSPAFQRVDTLAAAFVAGGAAPAEWESWTTQERQRFLAALPRTLQADRLAALDRAYGLNDTGNSELRYGWLQLALPNGYAPARASAERFLLGQGRRKFVAPLFETLLTDDPDAAQALYARARPGYHAVTTATVDTTLGYRDGKPGG